MKVNKTDRGFFIINFTDSYGVKCSLQESSNVIPHVWLGVDDVEPELLGSDGWKPYDIPEQVFLNSRMHLSVEQAAALIPYLKEFVKTGFLVKKANFNSEDDA